MNENSLTVKSYEDNPEDYINSRSFDEQKEFSKWIVDELRTFGENAFIFEVGSGPGYTADYLEFLGYDVARSDVVSKFIEFNQKRGKTIRKYDVITDSIEGYYDVVIAINVMQHMNQTDMIRALKNVYECLVKNGKFLFTIKLGDTDEWHEDKGGARYFASWRETELEQALLGVGFRVDSINSIGYKNWANVVARKAEGVE